MEEGEIAPFLSKKELRKQKLMEYLTAKGKLKDPNPKSYLRGDSLVKRPLSSKAEVGSGKENKTLADRLGHERKNVSSQPSLKPPRNVLGVHNKVNVKDGLQTGRQDTVFKRATNSLTQPHLKPVLKKSATALGSVSAAVSRSNPKIRSNTGTQPSVRYSSKSDCTAVPLSASRFTSSNTVWSCPMRTAGSRISSGVLVKTRTGLVPAVTQPLHTPSQSLARNSAPATNTRAPRVAADKSRHKATSALATVSKRPAVAPRSLPSSGISQAARDKSTSRTSDCTAALNKGKGTSAVTKPYKSDRRPTESSTRQMFQREGNKNGQPVDTSSQQSHQVAASRAREFRRSAPAAATAAPAAASANTIKEKASSQTFTKKGQSFVNSKPPQVGWRRTVSSVTVPRPPRVTSCTSQAAVTAAAKTPAKTAPQTEGRKITAAQEERMRKLREWQEAKGISYKRPSLRLKAQDKPSEGARSPSGKDEVDSLVFLFDRSLSDCIKLIEEGSPAEQVRMILSRLPAVSRKFTKYWICQARLMEREGNLDVLPMFMEAVRVVREPLEELRTVVFEILKKKGKPHACIDGETAEEKSTGAESSPEVVYNLLMTPKPVCELISSEEGNSSVVKYKVTKTPGRTPRQQPEPRRLNGQELRFLTPVRRSTRIERAALDYPESLREHDLCVASYKELVGEEGAAAAQDTPLYVYMGNEALGEKPSLQLVCTDDDGSANQCEPGGGQGGSGVEAVSQPL